MNQVTLNASSKITFDKNNWKRKGFDFRRKLIFRLKKDRSLSVNTQNGIVQSVVHFNVKQQRQLLRSKKCYEETC
jgi:hypothetical protein